MPSPRMTRQNQFQWLLVFVLSIVATFFGIRNLVWFQQQVFGSNEPVQSQLLEQGKPLT
jgi:hypothetical protein